MNKLTIYRESAINVIIFALVKSNTYYDKVEKHLIKTGILEDVGSPNEVSIAVENGNDDLLIYLIDMI